SLSQHGACRLPRIASRRPTGSSGAPVKWRPGGDARNLRRLSIQRAFQLRACALPDMAHGGAPIAAAGLDPAQWLALVAPEASVSEWLTGANVEWKAQLLLQDRVAMIGVLSAGSFTGVNGSGVAMLLNAALARDDFSENGPLEGKLLVLRSVINSAANWPPKERNRVRELLIKIQGSCCGEGENGRG